MLRHRLAGLVVALSLLPLALPASADPCIEQLPPDTPLSCPPPEPEPTPTPTPTPTPPPTGRADMSSYVGLGVWVDVYDWAPSYTNNKPSVDASDVDTMAARGVKTIYIQVAKGGAKNSAIINPTQLGAILKRAHAKQIRVAAWYLPLFNDLADDYRHLKAAVDFRAGKDAFDSVGVDIEWRNGVKNHDERSKRLVTLSKQIRAYAPKLPIAAITMPPVVMDELNKDFWPRFPWKAMKPYYDVWQPMSYWSNRASGTKWRNAYTYTKTNVDWLRRDLGDPKALVHPVGGIGNECSTTDWQNFVKAAKDSKSIGGSTYDYATTSGSAYSTLRGVPKG